MGTDAHADLWARAAQSRRMEQIYGDPLEPWRDWAPDLRGGRINSGHHQAEEAPEELTEALLAFLS